MARFEGKVLRGAVALALALGMGAACAAQAAGALPPALQKAAKRWKVNTRDVAIAVLPVDGVKRTAATSNVARIKPVLAWRADARISPASTAKTLTTLATLETLGASAHWLTSFAVDKGVAPDKAGRLTAPLYFVGGGDPSFVVEDFALEVERLAQSGIKHIEGDLVVDRSYFNVPHTDRFAFDGRGSRPYNLPADAALVNYRNLSFELIPDETGERAHVTVIPKLAGVETPTSIPIKKGACGDWKSAIGYTFEKGEKGDVVRFTGALPSACGPKNFNVISFSADDYLERLFRTYWERDGRTWTGHVREGAAPAADLRTNLVTHVSPDAADLIRLTNKWSNNTMARHLFLSLGRAWAIKEAEAKAKAAVKTRASGESTLSAQAPEALPAGTLEDARAALSAWLKTLGVAADKVYVENGSGLSRDTHVTARVMAQVLAAGAKSPYAVEFASSLPITGEDGTMIKRKVAVSYGRIKTGFLTDVRSIAGYVDAKNGRRYAVYASVHGMKNMPGGIAFLDNVILWVYNREGK